MSTEAMAEVIPLDKIRYWKPFTVCCVCAVNGRPSLGVFADVLEIEHHSILPLVQAVACPGCIVHWSNLLNKPLE